MDTPAYINWTSQMLARPFPQAISYAFSQADSGFRPLPLIIFYSIASLGISPQLTVEFSPIIFGPLLSLSLFYFVKAGSGNGGGAAISAFAGCFSFNVTVGIWAGYLANWMAMIIAYFFLGSFFLFERSKRRTVLLPLFLLSLALLLTHPWTWALILATIFVYAIVRSGDQRKLLTVSSVFLIFGGIVVDFAKNQVAGGSTLAADLGTKAPVFGFSQFLMSSTTAYWVARSFWVSAPSASLQSCSEVSLRACLLAGSPVPRYRSRSSMPSTRPGSSTTCPFRRWPLSGPSGLCREREAET